MRLRLRMGVAVGALAGLSLCALAAAPANEPHEIISGGGPSSSLAAATVTNEPFSATWTKEIVQTLTDGTKVTRHGHHFVARDSEGRVRVEERLTKGTNGHPGLKLVYVKDPVAHTLTTWLEGGTVKHVATVMRLPEHTNGVRKTACEPCAQRRSSRPQPVVTVTDLGSQVVDNLAVSDKLTTIVYPQGWGGSNQPITATREVWTSDEMKLIVKQKVENPRRGESVVQLENLSRAEPPAALFLPPAGYKTQTALEGLKQIMAKLQAAEDAQEME